MKKVLLSNNEILLISDAIDFYANHKFKAFSSSLNELENKLNCCRAARVLIDKLACSEDFNG